MDRVGSDVERELGDADAARAAWIKALTAVPIGVAEQPEETEEHAIILQRLDRRPEAQQVASPLNSLGYRRITL